MRPDRIILGELRGEEAFAFLRAINTGHPGSMTTVHADSAERAIEQIVLLVLQAGTQLNRDDVRHYVSQHGRRLRPARPDRAAAAASPRSCSATDRPCRDLRLAEAIPAATLVLMREAEAGPPELLVTERTGQMAFAAGALVFPGGRIDPDDHDSAAGFALPDAAARIAAIRETIEETGLAIGLRPAPDAAATGALREGIMRRRAVRGPARRRTAWRSISTR